MNGTLTEIKDCGQAVLKAQVQDFGSMDDLQANRKLKLQRLLKSGFGDRREHLCKKAEISEGRLSQLLRQNYPFGERAARALEQKLDLDPMYFDRFDAGPKNWPEDVRNAATILAGMSESQRRRAWSVLVALQHADESDGTDKPPRGQGLN